MADIIAPIKKPNYLIPRQLGYLVPEREVIIADITSS